MKERLLLWLCAILAAAMSGCGAVDKTTSMFDQKPKAKSQVEIRQMQTRDFDTKDTAMVLKAMIDVLQDDGYIVKQANKDLGFFNAVKEVDQDAPAKAWGSIWWGLVGQWTENTVYDCTANISEFGEQTRVRVNFQLKQMNNLGGADKVYTVDDPKFYQEFFSKVDKGIFMAKEKI